MVRGPVSINYDKIPIQEETLKLREQLFNKINNKNFKLVSNLSREQVTCIKQFVKEKPFLLSNTDKNVGWCCLDKSLYIKLAEEHLLGNPSVYKKLDFNPLTSVINTIINDLTDLNDKGHISNRLFKVLCPTSESKLGKFKWLAKLHKNIFGIRPIINCRNHPTEKLSHFLDLFLQPFVKSTDSYLKDSQNLIQKCQDLTFKDNYFLYSCDFESLYTNINSQDAILSISDFFKDKMSPFIIDLDIIGLNKILSLILNNNIFSFLNNNYIQSNGLAMGGKAGPSIANIYVHIKEHKWVSINKTESLLAYNRFIDDIALMTKHCILNSNFTSIFGDLKLNIVSNKEVQFLDLLISKDFFLDKLSFRLYTKPTNTFQYLFHTSNHPNFIFKNIPISLFIRLRRSNSELTQYLYEARTLISNLMKRGYDLNDLLKKKLIISNINRDSLIPYKDKSLKGRNYDNTCIKFIINYDINYINMKYDFMSIVNSLNNLSFNNLRFSLLHSTNYNLNDILINNYKLEKTNFLTLHCDNPNCLYCKFKF